VARRGVMNVNLVRSFQEAVNRHNVDEILAMFHEDAEFEIVGQSGLSGRQEIRNIFDYDVGVNTELRFINCKSEGNSVHCQILEQNDRLDAIGIRELEYASCTLVFKEGLIESFTATISDESMRYIMEKWQDFIPWITKNYPDEYSRMFTSEGRFIYNRENGRGVVPLLREWRISQTK
jgi:hypothetical protein